MLDYLISFSGSLGHWGYLVIFLGVALAKAKPACIDITTAADTGSMSRPERNIAFEGRAEASALLALGHTRNLSRWHRKPLAVDLVCIESITPGFFGGKGSNDAQRRE